MLQNFLEQLCGELEMVVPELNEQKVFPFRLNPEVEVHLKDLNPGIACQARISLCPEKKREDFFIYLMRANLLGQGTGGARIGLDRGEKFLTLSLGLPYELNYKSFKETLEDFVNYLVYWREEVAKFEREEGIVEK